MQEKRNKVKLLFRRIQEGNVDAFNELFQLYYPKLRAFAINYVKQKEVAEELSSELFIKLWLKRDKLEQVLRPEIYLFISIKNACLNFIRSEKRNLKTFEQKPELESLEVISSNHNEFMEEKELNHLLCLAVEALPSQRKIIFKLIKEEGLKSKAVAEILGISVRTVENQLYKALRSIADVLSDHLGYHPQKRMVKLQELSAFLFFC